MSPARILAVTRLAIEVVEDLADQDMGTMRPCEADFAMLLFPHLADLRDIADRALAEMQQLPLPFLEGYPTQG